MDRDPRVSPWLLSSLVALAACTQSTDAKLGANVILPVPPANPAAMMAPSNTSPVNDVTQPPMNTGVAMPVVDAGTMHAAGAAGTSGPVSGDPEPMAHVHMPCIDPEPVAAADATITKSFEPWTSPQGEVDLLLPKPVITWMDERLFREAHDAWHIVRKCFNGFGFLGMTNNDLCSRDELKPAEQECEGATDGYQFLVVHRHMLQTLRQAFPAHAEMFAAFPHFPFDAQDVPEEWRDRFGTGWSAQIIDTATALEDIENQLDRFATEGDLGAFIQCGGMTTPGGANGASSIHGALHFKWIVNGSPVLLGDQATNTANFMFWKLHGWIDEVWERYRIAKGLLPDQPELKTALTDQCREMHMLGKELGPQMGQTPITDLPDEAGFFHESVRPILEKNCSGCHSGTSPEGGMILGGNVSSADVVKNLVGVQTVRGGQFKRVVAGDADRSWFYLKPSGNAANAGCTGTCNAQVMPPTGMVTLGSADLATIRKWIADGAAAPTTP